MQGKPTKKARDFLFAEPLKSVGKKGKRARKQIGERKKLSKDIQEKQGLEGQVNYTETLEKTNKTPLEKIQKSVETPPPLPPHTADFCRLAWSSNVSSPSDYGRKRVGDVAWREKSCCKVHPQDYQVCPCPTLGVKFCHVSGFLRIAGPVTPTSHPLLRNDQNWGKRKQHKHKLFWSRFPADIPDPYIWVPWGLKFSPHHRGRSKTQFLVRTSTIVGADVHDPKGS